MREAYARLFSENRPFDVEYRMQHRDGHWMTWHDRAVATEEREGKLYADGLVSNITEPRQLEEQLRQLQKMEAIGQLAGGVAHDFNNLLMVIQGNVEIMSNHMADVCPERKNCEEIRRAAERAASLTRQLLAFSRTQVLNPKVMDLKSHRRRDRKNVAASDWRRHRTENRARSGCDEYEKRIKAKSSRLSSIWL